MRFCIKKLFKMKLPCVLIRLYYFLSIQTAPFQKTQAGGNLDFQFLQGSM